MRKLLLTLAVLCGTVSGWAQESSSDPVIADGVYTITNVISGRGTLIAVDGQRNVGAANVTLSGYEGKSEDAMENGDKWYVFTLFGNTYLYNLGNGEFLNSRQADAVQFNAAPVSGFSLTAKETCHVISHGNYKVSCCPGYDKGQTVRWLSKDEAASQHLTFTYVANGEDDFADGIAAARVKVTTLETLTNPKTGTEYVLYDAAHKVFLDINNLTNEPGQDGYNSLASLNSEKQSLYITAGEGLTWKIHTTAEGGKYLGQYTDGRQWNTKVNEDQSEFAWTINPVMEDGNLYVNLQNTSGIQNGYLGNEGHANGSALFVNQTEEARKLKLMLHEASLVYKVVTTEAAGAVVYAGKNYTNGEYIFALATLTEADLAAKHIPGKTVAVTLDKEAKTITLTYTHASNFVAGDKFFIRNRDKAANYIAIQFDGGKLDNSQEPTIKRIYFTNGSNKDYKFCWELKATTHNDEECFLLYNPYYDWYVGPLTGTTSNTHMSKNADGAGRFKIEKEGDYFVFHSLTTNVTAQNGALDCNFLHLYEWGGSEIVGWARSANASQWLVEEVTEEMEAQWQNTLASQYSTLTQTQHKIGTGASQYSGMPEEMIDGFNALTLPEEASAIEKARYSVYALYEYGSAVDALTLNMPPAGFYRIKSTNSVNDSRNGQYVQNYVNGNGLTLNRDTDARSIMYFCNNNLLSYASGKYLNGYSGNDLIGEVGTTPTTWTIEENTNAVASYALSVPSGGYMSDWADGSKTSSGQKSKNETWTFEPVESLPVTITPAGYATFYSPVAVTLPDDLKAYYVSSTTNDKAQMTEISGVIPANTGVILKGETKTYYLTIAGEAESVTNKLSGTVASEYISTPSYVLSAQGDPAVVGFYKAMLNFTVADGIGTKVTENGTHFLNNGFKAYLPADGNNARSLVFDFGGIETGIDELKGENGNVKAEVYDLAGRRVQNAQKGVFIVNGKVIVK